MATCMIGQQHIPSDARDLSLIIAERFVEYKEAFKNVRINYLGGLLVYQ